MCIVSLRLVNANKFWPGFTFPQPVFSNFIGVRSLSHWTPTYIWDLFHLACSNWLSSLSLVDPNKFWPGFTFPQPSFSNFIGVRFAQPLNTNIHIGFVSLGLLNPNKFWPEFTFSRSNFSKIYWGLFRSASQHQHFSRISFSQPSEPNQKCAVFPSGLWT